MKYRLMGFSVLTMLGSSLAADAGLRVDVPVQIIRFANGGGNINGSLSSTRNSLDSTTQLSCRYSVFQGTKLGSCFASDGVQTMLCIATDPNQIDTISRIASDSYVTIIVDATGVCQTIEIEAASWTAPKNK